MKVIKRNGMFVDYDPSKIRKAIDAANKEVKPKERATRDEVKEILSYIEGLGEERLRVEEIQDIIEEKLMEFQHFALAKKYIIYRYKRALVRKSNTTDRAIKELIDGENE